MDKISHLPEHLQHRILGFLEQEEVGRAAVLSKVWRSIVQSHPVLSFTQSHFEQTYVKIFGLRDAFLMRGHCAFSNLIDELIRKKSLVQKFSLRLTSCHHRHAHWQSQLDSWIQHLVKVGGVQELTLCLDHGSEPDSPLYIFPPSGLCSKTLTKLTLSSSFNVDVKHSNKACLPNLRELTLDISDRNSDMFQVFISGCPNLLGLALSISNFNDQVFKSFVSSCPNLLWLSLSISNSTQQMFDNFVCGCPNLLKLHLRTSHLSEAMCKSVMSGCPNLEILTLYLSDSKGVSSICVSGLTRLHSVYLDGGRFTRVKIVAPGLRMFKFSGSNGNSTEIDLLACESTLKVLSFCGLRLTKETLTSCISKFPELEELALLWLNVDGIVIPNNKIRKLEVANCYELENFEIGAFNLEFLSFFCMFCRNFRDMSSSWINTFKEYYPNLTRFEDIKLTLRHEGKLIICEVLDERFLKMLYEIKEKQPRLEVLRIGSYERVLDRIFSQLGFSNKIDYVFILSRNYQSHELYLQVLNNMTVKGNVEQNCWRKGTDSKGRHVLHHLESIPTGIPSYLKSYDTVECHITHIRLHWIPMIGRGRYIHKHNCMQILNSYT